VTRQAHAASSITPLSCAHRITVRQRHGRGAAPHALPAMPRPLAAGEFVTRVKIGEG
jgi:hypothetical protein